MMKDRDPIMHDLKCHPEPFHQVRVGLKNFEIRVNDRDYRDGDIVRLKEYDPTTKMFSGLREGPFTVGTVIPGGAWGLPDNVCVFALLPYTAETNIMAQRLSPYDQAVEDLARYLPEWVRFLVQKSDGKMRMLGEHAEPVFSEQHGWMHTTTLSDPLHPGEFIYVKEFDFLTLPLCEGGRSQSLRRIESGRVVRTTEGAAETEGANQ